MGFALFNAVILGQTGNRPGTCRGGKSGHHKRLVDNVHLEQSKGKRHRDNTSHCFAMEFSIFNKRKIIESCIAEHWQKVKSCMMLKLY